ncbi:uncharacterized protein [Fopius arisanus]|uniref:SYNGAP1 protein n=1 Tax=Fopius arisanus TaxID=64838 RepID=A0A0C9QYL4_9HYME|nr:PREDICTED: uncharacterized protein LOC105267381 isoform X2 [Fopius arisanus]
MSCRRKIDSKLSVDYTAMEIEVRSLKLELTRTRDALKTATKRCRELVQELDSLTVCHESERNLRDQQLSKILRALLVLESRLRQEQKSIRQQLCEKDNVIKNQQIEIAKLRRYTKNYIKSKREQVLCKSPSTPETMETPGDPTTDIIQFDNGLGSDIQILKREIITKFSNDDMRNCVRKTDSFAGSDVSKESLTSSENTDGSIVTTTDGSPSLISTEGFCEGESSDLSPGSTLNKSRTIRKNSDSDSEGRTVLENLENLENLEDNTGRRRIGVLRKEPLMIIDNQVKIMRSESKDDGMDCNFVSGDEEEGEPLYVNSCCENNKRNRECETRLIDDNQNNNNNGLLKMEKSGEETSGNWYSDPDEDRIADDIIRHNSYRPNSNHNSVLECVNQILLRDMEDEETIRSVSRKFKHRGRIVSFQPARLSDIESVGSEMERRNSEEVMPDRELDASEDEFGMRVTMKSQGITRSSETESNPEDEIDDNSSTRAIPIVVIEPNLEMIKNSPVSPEPALKSRCSPSPILRLERIEEKTCLSMSSKGLTIAKNLDYEDIESLPEVISPHSKIPPALPPKPQFKNNTLVLKKIPSPSFLIDETRRKVQVSETPAYVKRIFGISGTPSKPPIPTARSLNFKDSPRRGYIDNGNAKVKGNEEESDCPRVTNIVKHFEEFKIGESDRCKELSKGKSMELEEMDIRQNFEEFNLDECDLSDDPDRPEGDGSERLGSGVFSRQESVKDNNNGESGHANGVYDHFLEATGLSNKSILTPSRLLSNHKSMLKPKDVKYKSKIKATGGIDKIGASGNQTQVRHWTGPFV